ncbi:MAG: Phosphoenolpyruvate synthase [Patescibacteria group bacterium]|nr:Phosphoenolpyruvate synthase [Patescibacteria group bacterium]
MQNYTKLFKNITKKDSSIAGGKGASLGEMLNAGIPVPDGYVVIAETFDHFIKETDLIQEIESILKTVDNKTVSTVDHASEKIQGLIKSVKMPQDIADEITSQFKNLDTKYVAVRSSATAEDGADHAWAGQLDSFLNTTENDLLEKVQHCWASLFTPRAIFYRFEKGLDTTKISVAVVVQKMVNSEKSGIAFSVHPVTEDRNQMIIEAGLGLGEAIVSGSVTPDAYVVNKNPKEIIDTNVSTQSKALYRTEGGGNTWKDLTKEESESQVLSKEQIFELAIIIETIENHYGFPCDIEWAFEDGKFYIVQSRPITTLSPIAESKQKEKWVIAAGDFNAPFIKNYCTSLGYAKYKEEYGFVKLVGCACHNGDIDYIVVPSTWDSAHIALKNIVTQDPIFLDKTLDKIEDFGKEFNKWTEVNFLDNNLKNLNNKEILNLLNEFIKKQSFLYTKGTIFSILDYGKYKFVEDNLNKILTTKITDEKDRADAFEVFTTPTKNSFQLDHELEMKEMLLEYQNDPVFNQLIDVENIPSIEKQYPDFWKKIKNHTQKYNWIFYSYMGPAYTEKDFIKIAKDMLSKKTNLLDSINDHQESVKNILNKRKIYLKRIGPTNFENTILTIAEKMVWAKPRRKDYQSKSYYHLSFLFEEIASRAGLTMDQVFYCTLEMLNDVLEGKKIKINEIDNIRKLHVAIPTGSGEVIVYVGEDAENFCKNEIQEVKKHSNLKEIKGSTAYKGFARGVVKIINKPQDMEKMNHGDILVSLATTPDIVTAMKKAQAIVTDKGGLTCHAAIVARELKIPCVVGTEISTQILKDGDEVEVDASGGIIKILSKN